MDKNPLIKECLTVGIILVLLGVYMIPSTAQDTKKPSPISSSSWVYVNGIGQGNHTIIQSAIDLDTAIVHILTGYLPPYNPKNPHPEDNAVGVPINTDLSWIGGDPDVGDIVTYDVFFWSELPIQKVASNISITSYDLGILADYVTYIWSIVAWDNHSNSTQGPTWHFTTSDTTNYPPKKPSQPTGQPNGFIGYEYTYTTSTIDPDANQVYYLWDWGAGNFSGWFGPYNSGLICATKHTWNVKGNYSIKVKAKDIYNVEGNWSDPLPITMPYSYKSIQWPCNWLVERFPDMFPIIWYLLGH